MARSPYPYSQDVPPLRDPRTPEIAKKREPIAGGQVVKIALLLPLTGESGALGQAMALLLILTILVFLSTAGRSREKETRRET